MKFVELLLLLLPITMELSVSVLCWTVCFKLGRALLAWGLSETQKFLKLGESMRLAGISYWMRISRSAFVAPSTLMLLR